MRVLLSFSLLLSAVPWAWADVRQEGEAWVVENAQLMVTVGTANTHLTVLDKTSGTLWRQEEPSKHSSNKDDVRARHTTQPVVVDGIAVKGSGGQVVMDGVGDNEDFGFTGQPQWFAAFGPKYRSACFALMRAEGFTYWDSGTHRGQMDLGCPGSTERRVFLWGQGTNNADFAKEVWQAYAETLTR